MPVEDGSCEFGELPSPFLNHCNSQCIRSSHQIVGLGFRHTVCGIRLNSPVHVSFGCFQAMRDPYIPRGSVKVLRQALSAIEPAIMPASYPQRRGIPLMLRNGYLERLFVRWTNSIIQSWGSYSHHAHPLFFSFPPTTGYAD